MKYKIRILVGYWCKYLGRDGNGEGCSVIAWIRTISAESAEIMRIIRRILCGE